MEVKCSMLIYLRASQSYVQIEETMFLSLMAGRFLEGEKGVSSNFAVILSTHVFIHQTLPLWSHESVG